MPEGSNAARESRYWKITINPEECPRGAWAVCQTTALAMLGQPGEEGEASPAVRNMKRLAEGDWLIAYTPQEGSYRVGGIGRVTRGYRCESGPFDHPWSGPVRRSVGVDWQPGACSIAELVKEGRFRKGKIPRVLDEITPEEFAAVRELVHRASGCAEAGTACASARGLIGNEDTSDTATGVPLAAAAMPERATDHRVPAVKTPAAPQPGMARPAAHVLDPQQEQPPLPDFFVEWAREDRLLGPDWRLDGAPPAPASRAPAVSPARPRPAAAANRSGAQRPQTITEAVAAVRRSREAHLLASFSSLDTGSELLDFGLPTIVEDEPPEIGPEPVDPLRPRIEVWVGAPDWTSEFRREMQSGRPCSLLLRGPQYSFLNMTPAGTTLRGLPLFALFAIGAVGAPGKEAFRSGACFIFRGRRAEGEYEVEVQPRRSVLVFREPAEAGV